MSSKNKQQQSKNQQQEQDMQKPSNKVPSRQNTKQKMDSLEIEGRQGLLKQRITVDDIVREIPFGRFQYLMIFIFHLIYSAPSIVVYNYAFFLMFPKYLCKQEDMSFDYCTREQKCDFQMNMDIEQDFQSEIDWNSPYSLRNWIMKLGLECSETYVIGLFGTLEFLGQLFACFVYPPLADYCGRRIFTFIGLGMQTVVFVGLVAFKNFELFYLLIFILGNAVIIRYLIVYAHLMEFVATKQNLITGIFLFMDGLVYIYSPVIIVYFTRKTQYFVYMALGLSIGAVVLLAFIFHMPESLKFSLVKQDIMKFQSDMDYICTMNKASEQQVDKINSLVEKYCNQVREDALLIGVKVKQPGLIKQILSDRDALVNLMLMVVCWASTTFTYFLVIFYVKYLPGDIYYNQIVSSFSVFAYLVAPFMARKYDNKMIMLIGYIISFIFLVIMIIFQFVEIDAVAYSFIFLLFKCGVTLTFLSLFIIHTDLFHIQFLATSYGICNIVSRIITLGAPIVAELDSKLAPMLFMIILNLAAIAATAFLRLKKREK
ncbi:organic cation [Stylonychia lemnae]|uniref:Organic cation n=1 Tax=Stylonychia lemnae TaxID=5949 RepID=A0A078A614_STYLE|nr:organic cation [Stylonychia lemnae]|eukprot:CDW77336.1 organic cation [Stylonychia lemnae]